MAISKADAQGILGNLFSQLGGSGIKTPPTVTQNQIVVTITEAELAAMAIKGVDPKMSQNISVACKEGKVEITVKLW